MKLAAKWRRKHHPLRGDGDDGDFEDDSEPIDSQEQEEMVRSFERDQARQSRFWRVLGFTFLSFLLSAAVGLDFFFCWFFQRVFAGFLIGYIAFLVYSTLQQAWYPWELCCCWNSDFTLSTHMQRYHAYFMEEIHSWMVVSADLVAVLACSFAVKGIVDGSKSPHQWMWYSCYTGLLVAIFWFLYMLRLPKFRWEILWLPLGPLSGAGICLYVDRLLHESLEDVKQLRSYMYNYKSL